jgi:hypothetical protein
MIRHLLQIFFTLGLTFIVVSSGAGVNPGACRAFSRGIAAGSAAALRCLLVRYL